MSDLAKLRMVLETSGQKTVVDAMGEVDQAVDRTARNTKSATERMADSWSKLQGAIGAIGIGFVLKSTIDAALQIERLDKLFNAATGSANLAAREMEYVRNMTNRLGLELLSTTESYGKFLASIRGTSLEGEKGRKVFEGVSAAAVALGLRADETSGIFNALQQMMSKGKVQSEELVHQLGDRLPGALKAAADGMGMSSAELLKQMELGKIMAADLLPKLADQLQKTYGKAALEGANGAQAAINRMNNAMLESKAVAGSALMPTFTSLVENVFTPLVKLIGLAVKGLQSMAAAAALVVNQFMGGLGDILSGKVFTKEGYKQSMADAQENQAIYQSQMAKIWGGPSSADYTAAEMLRQAGNKSVAPLGGKSALTAQQKEYQSQIKEFIKGAWDGAATQLAAEDFSSDVTKKLGLFNNKPTGFTKTPSFSLGLDLQLQSLEQQHAATKKLDDAEAARLKGLRDIHRELERQLAIQREIAALQADNSAFAASQVGTNNRGEVTDPFSNQMAIEADFHQTRMARINELQDANLAAVLAGTKTQAEAAATMTALDQQAVNERIKNAETLAKIQADASQAAWNDVLTHAKKAVPQLAAFDKLIAASQRDYTVKGKDGVVDQTRTNLAMYGGYTSAVGDMFSGLAAQQNTASREGFETAKAFNIGAAVMSTASAIMNAMASIPYPMNIAAAAVTGAMGAIQIAKIASTSFGGGASAPTVSAGSFGGSGAVQSSVGGSIGTRYTSLQDSQSQEQLQNIAGSMENASLAIGKVADGLTKVTDLFSEGGFLSLAAGAAPGIGGTTGNPGGVGILKGLLALDPLHVGNMINPASFVQGIGNTLFGWGNKYKTTGGGFTLGLDGGDVESQNYITQKKKGGWFSSDKKRSIYSEGDAAFTDAVQSAVDQIQATIIRSAVATGTSADFSQASMARLNIATAGRKPEDIQKDLEAWFTDASNVLAKTVKGLQDFTFYGEDAFDALVRLSTALQSTNEGLELIGSRLIDSTLEGANAAWKLQDMMGGAEKFTDAIDEYFDVMFTDAEQSAQKAAQAQRQVNTAFAEMQITVPQTATDFRRLVEGLDVTTERGAQLFAALMDISPAFGQVQDQIETLAEKAREFAAIQMESNYDLEQRTLIAQGKQSEADFLAKVKAQQDEIREYEENGLDTRELVIVQMLEYNAALQKNQQALNDANNARTNLTSDLLFREYKAKGDAAGADLLRISFQTLDKQRQELEAYRKAGMDAAEITRLQTVHQWEYAEAMKQVGEAAKKAATDMKNSIIDLALRASQTLVSIQGGNLSTGSPESIYRGQQASFAAALNTGNKESIISLAQPLLEASRAYNASGAAYGRDFDMVARALADIAAMPDTIDPTLAAANKQIDILTAIKENTALTVTSSADLLRWVVARQKAEDALQMSVGLMAPMTTHDLNADGLVNIVDALGWLRAAEGLPSFDTGTPYVSRDMTANIHEGEIIMDRASANALRKYGIPVSGSADNKETIAELKEQNRLLRSLLIEQKASVRVQQSGFSQVIENTNNKQANNQIRLGKAA